MPQTYNGLIVPTSIKPSKIISAFANHITWSKVEEYTIEMQRKMLGHDFPPIMGFPRIIDEDDVISETFLDGTEITEDMIGQLVWMVTDGHHRSLAAIAAGLPYIETTLDYSTITDEVDLKNFES